LNGVGQRVAKVLVVAFAKAETFHDHRAAEIIFIGIERNELLAFFLGQDWTHQCMTAIRKFRADPWPIEIGNTLLDCVFHAAEYDASKRDDLSENFSGIKIHEQISKSRQSEQLPNIFAHLMFPVRPVVAAHRAPIVERMANALAGKNS
jgi:hypothetical protein